MEQINPKIGVEYVGEVTVATPTNERILEDNDIHSLETSLLPLIEQNPGISLVIDFGRVKFLSSSVLGLLIRISKKIYESQGKLRLCSIDPKIMEIFKITRLDKIFEIAPDRETAIAQIR